MTSEVMTTEAAAIRSAFIVRVLQDGNRDASTNCEYRADESGGWVWEASHACETALVATAGAGVDWEAQRVLELGSGTGWLSLKVACLGASVTATDREGALPSLLRNVLRNQQRAFTQDGEQALRVAAAALDWEDEFVRQQARAEGEEEEEEALRGPFDFILGSDLIYNSDMHEPLLTTIARRLGSAACVLSWEQRKPAEEAAFLEMARSRFGFSCDIEHQTTSSVNGSPITAHCLRLPPERQPAGLSGHIAAAAAASRSLPAAARPSQ